MMMTFEIEKKRKGVKFKARDRLWVNLLGCSNKEP
jgi:hypothetical protein